jgi:SAM-dependent methyltransferase
MGASLAGRDKTGRMGTLMADLESFSQVTDPDDIDWEAIEHVTVVCFVEDPSVTDGVSVVLYRGDGRWVTPSGARLADEDVWDDALLRIPMETMGFRRQETHPFALDHARRHVVFWVTGGTYTGTRMSAPDVEWWTGPVDAAASLLASQGDDVAAGLVAAAGESRRTMSYERRVADVNRTLVGPYLSASTPQGGSGFGGSDEDWRDSRGTLADALDASRSEVRFLDHACANGHLAVSMVAWGAERGVSVEPYGVDIAPGLVERARSDHPDLASHFWVGDALDWVHPNGERFDLVHVLLDVVPAERHRELIQHQVDRVVAPGGRLLLSEYGDPPSARSAEAQATRAGFTVAGRCRQPTRGGRERGFPSVWIDV